MKLNPEIQKAIEERAKNRYENEYTQKLIEARATQSEEDKRQHQLHTERQQSSTPQVIERANSVIARSKGVLSRFSDLSTKTKTVKTDKTYKDVVVPSPTGNPLFGHLVVDGKAEKEKDEWNQLLKEAGVKSSDKQIAEKKRLWTTYAKLNVRDPMAAESFLKKNKETMGNHSMVSVEEQAKDIEKAYEEQWGKYTPSTNPKVTRWSHCSSEESENL